MTKKRIHKYVFDDKKELGRGTFGTVYEGKLDAPNQKPEKVAIKMLNKKTINSNHYLKDAFLSEIKTLRKIISTHIVGFKQVIQTENHYYIVQQFCDGGDLHNYLQKQGPLPEKKAVEFMIEILTGFFDIMRCGIVHRDFKPQNVLISKGKLKIADFGLARPTGQVLNSEVGTPLYQSPQILNGQAYSSKCDIWAIGLVFYQMLYSKLPWQGHKNGKKAYYDDITKNKLVFPDQPQVRPQIKKFIENCLVRDQSGRMVWSQLFRNEIFQNHLPNYQILDQIFCYTVNQIMNTIQEQQLDLKQIFKKYNENRLDKPMSRKDLHIMIKKLAPNVKSYHMDFVLSKFDKNSDSLIDFQQFKKTLKSAQQIKFVLSSQQIRTVIFRWAQHAKQQYVQKCKIAWRNLQQRLSQKQNLQNYHSLVMRLFPNRTEFRIDQEQFSHLLRQWDNELSNEECYIIFRLFDNNGDDIISGDQYYKNMTKLMDGVNNRSKQS